jgi:hypothetical protein
LFVVSLIAVNTFVITNMSSNKSDITLESLFSAAKAQAEIPDFEDNWGDCIWCTYNTVMISCYYCQGCTVTCINTHCNYGMC